MPHNASAMSEDHLTAGQPAQTMINSNHPAEDSMPTANVEDDQNYQFYKEYCRLYYANIILTNRL